MTEKHGHDIDALRERLRGRCIGLCVTNLGGGGTERYCELIARAFRPLGIKVVLFVEGDAPEGRDGEKVRNEYFDKVVYNAIDQREAIDIWSNKVGLFHLNVWRNEGRWIEWFKRENVPYIATLHTSLPLSVWRCLNKPWKLGTLLNALRWVKMVRNLGCPIIAISSWNHRRITRALPSVPCFLIFNGIPDPIISDVKPSAKQVAWIGSFIERKRPILALEVARIMGPDVALVMAGDGPEMGRCEKFKRDHSLNNVQFSGYVKDPNELLARSQLLLITSKWEGIPYVAVEAMANACPIVATPCGAFDQLLEETRAGLSCEAKPRALAAAIRSIFTAGDEVASLSRNAYEQLFTFNRFAHDLAKAYESSMQ